MTNIELIHIQVKMCTSQLIVQLIVEQLKLVPNDMIFL